MYPDILPPYRGAMKAVKRFINNLALRNNLLVFFLLASVIPLLAISFYFYVRREDSHFFK